MADLTLDEIVRRPLIDPSEDDVTRLILDSFNQEAFRHIASMTVGERPGLATAESLFAYMAFRLKASDTDAERNLISNIHARGVSAEHTVQRILNLAVSMRGAQKSGRQLREELPPLT